MLDARPPAVAGTFYPSDPVELLSMVEGFLGAGIAEPAKGVISPHAGLVYSGACAGKTFSRVSVPPVCVVIAPNHTGAGDWRTAASWSSGCFRTPLGDIGIASRFVDTLHSATHLVRDDRAAHAREHAVEVILPFLQSLDQDITLVPLILPWDSWDECEELARALVDAVKQSDSEVLLVASSDMTHYEPADRALVKDTHALEYVTRLDGRGLLDACRTRGITMCGRAPAAVVLEACKRLGATTATVADYRHSGMVTGDDSNVVAYAGVVIT